MSDEMRKKAVERVIDALAYASVVLVFILPLKFGMMAGVPETATVLPSSLMELFYFSWPYFVFTACSSLLLAGVAAASIFARDGGQTDSLLPQVLPWILLLASSLVGFLNASTLDFPLIQLNLFLGVACLAFATRRIMIWRPAAAGWYVNAVVASTILVALLGLNQYFSGFQDTLNYVYAKEMATGVKISPGMLSRLRETRVFATFSICNSLAAHLILTIPLCVWAILSKTSSVKTAITTLALYLIYAAPSLELSAFGFFLTVFAALATTAIALTRFPEKRKSFISLLILAPMLVVQLFVLRHTNSRGAFVAAAAAILAAALVSPLKTKVKLIGGSCALALVVPVLFTDILARSLKSMYFRFDYYLAALTMFAAHPFAGVGWGDFFHEYTRLKRVPGSEAPHTPHNFVLSFASQAGLAGGLAALWVLVSPFAFVWRRRGRFSLDWQETAILAGWLAWGIHSLADFNIQVPGTVGVAVVMLLMLAAGREEPSGERGDGGDGAPDVEASVGCETRPFVRWTVLSLAVVLSVAGLVSSSKRWRAESDMARLMRLCGAGVLGAERPVFPSESEVDSLLKTCVDSAPESPFPWICAGNQAQRVRDWSRAEYFFREAAKRSPERSSIYYHLFLSQAALGKRSEALHSLEKAAELFPNAYSDALENYKRMNTNSFDFR